MFPDTPEKEAAARLVFDQLSDEEKAAASKRAAFFWIFFFASFCNYLSLCCTAGSCTVLFAQAKKGDVSAFGKAIHIEPRLLRHHPYFRERHLRAQENSENRLSSRRHRPSESA